MDVRTRFCCSILFWMALQSNFTRWLTLHRWYWSLLGCLYANWTAAVNESLLIECRLCRTGIAVHKNRTNLLQWGSGAKKLCKVLGSCEKLEILKSDFRVLLFRSVVLRYLRLLCIQSLHGWPAPMEWSRGGRCPLYRRQSTLHHVLHHVRRDVNGRSRTCNERSLARKSCHETITERHWLSSNCKRWGARYYFEQRNVQWINCVQECQLHLPNASRCVSSKGILVYVWIRQDYSISRSIRLWQINDHSNDREVLQEW